MKTTVIFFIIFVLQCTAYSSKNALLKEHDDWAIRSASDIKNTTSESYNWDSYRPPYCFSVKGLFCILLYGMKNNNTICDIDERLASKIDKTTTDYFFVDLTQATDAELNQCKIDFPSLEGLYAISVSGNLIQKCTKLTVGAVDSILNRITELNRLYRINGVDLSVFKSFSKPKIIGTEKKNFFKIGSYNNVIVPSDFCEKGKSSVFIFNIPQHFYFSLKSLLLTDSIMDPEKVNFYFVNLACDDAQNGYYWSEIKTTIAMKVYAIEGMSVFPTVWIVSPTGSMSNVFDGNKTNGLPLYEYIVKSIENISLP